MSQFAILLGGDLVDTPRLRQQVAGARFVAADSGMRHASTLSCVPELWVGDFDSAGSELRIDYADVPIQQFPAEKNATDGELAVGEALRRGATRLVLVGGLGGQADHVAAHLGLLIKLGAAGVECCGTSGAEEAWPLLPLQRFDLQRGTRVSIVPWSNLEGLTLSGVKWPLDRRSVPVGSTLTLSNVAEGPVNISVRSGSGIIFLYPEGET